jgi:Tfp pilus assembly protein PilN
VNYSPINFAIQSFFLRACQAKPLVSVSFALASIALIYSVYFVGDLTNDLGSLERRFALQTEKSSSDRKSRIETRIKPASSTKIASINRAVGILNFDWTTLFSDLSQTSQKEVRILSIEINQQSKVVKISGEANTSEDMLFYIMALAASHNLAGADLIRSEPSEEKLVKNTKFFVEAKLAKAVHD